MMEIIEKLVAAYRALHLHEVLHYDAFNHYAITHHSTAIEGSTLTIEETRLLLDEGLTPNGKPLQHSLMVKDHFEALLFVLQSARQRKKIDSSFISAIASAVMHSTGSIYQTVFGPVDASKGEFRKGNVSAGNTYFVNYDKVISLTEKLCSGLNAALAATTTMQQQLDISFTAHFDLVSIHPFYDGNGRTSRLLMNFIQQLFNLPLAIVFAEDKPEYYKALQEARDKKDISIFVQFMYSQYQKYLQQEIAAYQKVDENVPDKRTGFSFVF